MQHQEFDPTNEFYQEPFHVIKSIFASIVSLSTQTLKDRVSFRNLCKKSKNTLTEVYTLDHNILKNTVIFTIWIQQQTLVF